jgi:hypothetical protein
MSNDRKLNPDEAAKKLQSMVSLGMPDTKYSGPDNRQLSPAEPAQTSKTSVEEKPPEQEASAHPTPAPVRRKRREQPESYMETYFRRIDFTDRQPLYITRATHEKLMLIVNIIGGRKATISSYVENILLQHLDSHREEISRLFDEHYINPVTDR